MVAHFSLPQTVEELWPEVAELPALYLILWSVIWLSVLDRTPGPRISVDDASRPPH